MSSNPHTKALVKLLQQNSHSRHIWEVFSDFVEMGAIAIANSLDIVQREAREARYMDRIGRYDKAEQARFPQMFGELVLALEAGPADVLGETFGALELGNAARGQFFTPYSICQVMAQVILGDCSNARAEIERKGFITAQEPAVGAGAMVIALAEAMQGQGINYQQHLHVTAVDVDARAAHMAYVQFSLLHIPATVIVGNTLSLEMRETWQTPAHILGMWGNKLRRGYALGSANDADILQPVAPELAAAPNVAPVADLTWSQPDLFAAAGIELPRAA